VPEKLVPFRNIPGAISLPAACGVVPAAGEAAALEAISRSACIPVIGVLVVGLEETAGPPNSSSEGGLFDGVVVVAVFVEGASVGGSYLLMFGRGGSFHEARTSGIFSSDF
jgi:hypothetical protein